MMQKAYLGLDVSKDKLDCCLMIDGNCESFTVDNGLTGFDALASYIAHRRLDWQNIYACCEYTNVYHRQIAQFLHGKGAKIGIVNPLALKHYVKMQMKRIKTDKQDARLIACYCRDMQPENWQPKHETAAHLQAMYRRTEQIKQMIVMERNRQAVADGYGRQSADRIINCLKAELTACENDMAQLINTDGVLKRQHDLLLSVPGIGKVTAPALMAVLADWQKFPTAKHLISYLGLSPSVRQSGKSKGGVRVSKMGDRILRKTLYMPARAACTKSKLWRPWFDEKVRQGKHPKKVYVLMMCKILRYAYTCLKTDRPFNENLHKAH